PFHLSPPEPIQHFAAVGQPARGRSEGVASGLTYGRLSSGKFISKRTTAEIRDKSVTLIGEPCYRMQSLHNANQYTLRAAKQNHHSSQTHGDQGRDFDAADPAFPGVSGFLRRT